MDRVYEMFEKLIKVLIGAGVSSPLVARLVRAHCDLVVLRAFHGSLVYVGRSDDDATRRRQPSLSSARRSRNSSEPCAGRFSIKNRIAKHGKKMF